MSSGQHLFEQEELMAFLDGELPPERAANAAAHLKNCLECQKLAADFQRVSQAMVSWQVEQAGSEIPASIAAALDGRAKNQAGKLSSKLREDRWEWRKLLKGQQLTWAGGMGAAVALVLVVAVPKLIRSSFTTDTQALRSLRQTEGDSAAPKLEQKEEWRSADKASASDKKLARPYIGVMKKFPPEYGRNAGSVTKVITKSGASATRESPAKATDAIGNADALASAPDLTTPYNYDSLNGLTPPPAPAPAATPAPGASGGAVPSASEPRAVMGYRNFGDNQPAQNSKQAAGGGMAAMRKSDSTAAKARAKTETVEVTADTALVAAPMIVHTATLMLTTKDFEKARPAVEDILKRHLGYVGEMNVDTPTGSARTLTATLRVPATQMQATLADLKGLGRVEKESQNGEEVTQQYIDLEARLKNSRNTEQRLVQLQRERTGKLSDVLSVENQISRVRGEIEQMEAESKGMRNQVDYATLTLTISEDYKAELKVVPTSTGNLIRNAAVDGYRSMVDGLLELLLWLLSWLPSLLLWAAILFFPARFTWRRLRHRFLQKELTA